MDGYVTIGTELDTKSFDAQIKDLEDKLDYLEKYANSKDLAPKEGTTEYKELQAEIEKTRNKLVDLRKKQDDVGKSDMSQIPTQLSNIGNSIESVIHKVTRWGLAIFGIRSAYNFVRGAISTLSSHNEQIATDVEYIRYSLATMLQPVIETIIKLAYKLLTYTAYIAKAWFGVNLFANASAKGFQNANKSAKQLQKTLAGFDEMNILNKDGSVGVSSVFPSMDLSNLENIKIPNWVEWIANNKKNILDFFSQLITILATAKITTFLLGLTGISTALKTMSGYKIFGMLGGILITIGGIYTAIEGLIKWIGDPTWENFTQVIEGLSIALVGIGISLVTINASNPLGWIAIAIGTVGTIIGAFSDWKNKTEETTEKLKDTKQATDDLREAQEELANQTITYTNAVKNAEKTQKNLSEAEKKNKMSGEDLFNAFQVGIITYENMNEAQREVFDAYVQNLEAQDRLKEATDKFTNAQNNANDASGRLSGAVYQETGSFDNYFQTLMNGFINGEGSADQFYRTLDETLSNMDKDARKTFYENLPKNVKNGIKISEDEVGKFPYVVSTQFNDIKKSAEKTFEDDIPNSIKTALNSNNLKSWFGSFKNTWNQMINDLNKNVGITASYSSGGNRFRAKGGIFYPNKLPKLAVGGIINQPGRGVPYNGAIIGERGAEAVVPLTDSQQMALLGETIGKYITINANITNTMNGRVISRELQKVQNDSDFAYNR